jgi:hypothetical protein
MLSRAIDHVEMKVQHLRENKWSGLIIGAIVYVLYRTIDGVIGNRFDDVLLPMWSEIKIDAAWSLDWIRDHGLFPLVLFLVSLGFSIYQSASRRALVAFAVLDDNFRLFFSTMLDRHNQIATEDAIGLDEESIENAWHVLATSLLNNAKDVFLGDYIRGMICLPEGELLVGKCFTDNMTPEAISNANFYIGSDENRRPMDVGIAGLAYKTGEPKIHKFNRKHAGRLPISYYKVEGSHIPRLYRGTRGDEIVGVYKELDDKPLRSSISYPLWQPGHERGDSRCMGILCFESSSSSSFDSDEIKRSVLSPLADRLVLALMVRGLLLSRLAHQREEIQSGIRDSKSGDMN